MSETIRLANPRIKYEGVFDWADIYATLYAWLKHRQYEFFEVKNVKKPDGYGYKIEYIAKAERKESQYVRYVIDIEINARHMEDIEIIEQGEKKKKNKAFILMIDIMPTIELDWQEQWETKFKKKARKFFHRYIMKSYIEKWKDKIYYEAYELHTKIKHMLDLESKYSAYDHGRTKATS